MVLAFKVGRQRPFWPGFWLSIATVTLYAYYWDYKTHREIHTQFELAREHRDDGTVWFMLGFLLPIFRYAYYHHFVSNTRYLRERFGFQSSLSPGAFIGYIVAATASFFVLVFVGVLMVGSGMQEDDFGYLEVANAGLVAAGALMAMAGLGLFLLLEGMAYHRLQRDLNEVWDAYDARASYLMAAAQEPGPAAPLWAPAPTAAVASPAPVASYPRSPPAPRTGLSPASAPGAAPASAKRSWEPGTPAAYPLQDAQTEGQVLPVAAKPPAKASGRAPARPAADAPPRPAADASGKAARAPSGVRVQAATKAGQVTAASGAARPDPPEGAPDGQPPARRRSTPRPAPPQDH